MVQGWRGVAVLPAPGTRLSGITVCPGSSDPFHIVSYHIKWGSYFLDIQYSKAGYGFFLTQQDIRIITKVGYPVHAQFFLRKTLMLGYGFLSENTMFVAELEKAGVKFIGELFFQC